ncbi:MAG: Fic family protein [Patescibacteria group bacterium]|jgi:Fic family protein
MNKNKLSKRLELEPTMVNKIYGLISQIDELKGQWKMGANLSPQSLSRLKKSVIVTSSGASTRIEGAKLTDEQVEKLLKGLKITKLVTRDEQEVAGYAELLANIFESYKNLHLSENLIKHFYAELLKYSEKDVRHKGQYKFGDNRVEAHNASGKLVGVLFETTKPHLVVKEMGELVDWTKEELENKQINSLLIIANFVFEFLSIHPFQDGNGRTSRVLTNLLLLKAGYEYLPYVSHEKLIEDNKENYYLALNKSQRKRGKSIEDITPWLVYFLEIILKQTKLALGLLDKENIENQLSVRQSEIWSYLKDHKMVTPKELREKLKIPAPTVVQALNKLLEMKKVERLGAGRSVRYKII